MLCKALLTGCMIALLSLPLYSYPEYNKAAALLDRSLGLEDTDWESALITAKAALEIAKANKYHRVEAKALFTIATINYYNVNRTTTLPYFEEGYAAAKLSKDKDLIYDYLIEIANYHLDVSMDFDTAAAYLTDAIELSKQEHKYHDTARAYAKLSIIYINTEDSDNVLECLEESEKYFVLSENPTDASYYYCDIGTRVWEYDMDLAVDLYLRGLEIDENHYYPNMCIGDAYISLGLPEASIPHLEISIDSLGKETDKYSFAMTNLAEAYFQLGDYAVADSICDDLISFLSPKKKALPTAYLIKGKIAELKGHDNEAIQLYQTSLETAEFLRTSLTRVNALLALGQIHLNVDQELSDQYCTHAYKDAVKHNYASLQSSACDCLYKTHKIKEDFDLALSYLEKKDHIEKSLNASTAAHKLTVLEKIGQRENEIDYQQKLVNEQYKSQLNTNKILLVALLFGLGLLLLLFRMMLRIKKQNEEINIKSDKLKEINDDLIQSNDDLERFAYTTSHDLKTPMLIITQFTKLLEKKLSHSTDPVVKDCIRYIDEGSERMTKLLDGVLEFSKTKGANTNMTLIDMRYLLNEISTLSINRNKEIEINIDYHSIPNIKWNYTRILLLFKNLIENGLKYNTSDIAQIAVYGKAQDGHHIIYIEDNGIGIEESYHDKIFVMFNRLHNQKEYKGSGLGLATCKKIVDNFGGEITVESAINKGSTFIIKIPNSMIVSEEAVSVLT